MVGNKILKVPIFKGHDVDKSALVIKADNTPDCKNVRIDNPIGALNNNIGMSKLNTLSHNAPITGLFQLNQHLFVRANDEIRYTLEGESNTEYSYPSGWTDLELISFDEITEEFLWSGNIDGEPAKFYTNKKMEYIRGVPTEMLYYDFIIRMSNGNLACITNTFAKFHIYNPETYQLLYSRNFASSGYPLTGINAAWAFNDGFLISAYQGVSGIYHYNNQAVRTGMLLYAYYFHPVNGVESSFRQGISFVSGIYYISLYVSKLPAHSGLDWRWAYRTDTQKVGPNPPVVQYFNIIHTELYGATEPVGFEAFKPTIPRATFINSSGIIYIAGDNKIQSAYYVTTYDANGIATDEDSSSIDKEIDLSDSAFSEDTLYVNDTTNEQLVQLTLPVIE